MIIKASLVVNTFNYCIFLHTKAPKMDSWLSTIYTIAKPFRLPELQKRPRCGVLKLLKYSYWKQVEAMMAMLDNAARV